METGPTVSLNIVIMKTCNVCLDSLTVEAYDFGGLQGSDEVRLSCGHAFHGQCAALWFVKTAKVSCPTCLDTHFVRKVQMAHACFVFAVLAIASQSWAYAQLALGYGIMFMALDTNVALLVMMVSLLWAPQEFLMSSFKTCALAGVAILGLITCF